VLKLKNTNNKKKKGEVMEIMNPNVIDIDVLGLSVNFDLFHSDMMVPFDNCLTGGTGCNCFSQIQCGCNAYISPCRVN